MLQFEQEHDTPASGSADWLPGPDWGSVLADNWQPRAIALVGSLNQVPRGVFRGIRGIPVQPGEEDLSGLPSCVFLWKVSLGVAAMATGSSKRRRWRRGFATEDAMHALAVAAAVPAERRRKRGLAGPTIQGHKENNDSGVTRRESAVGGAMEDAEVLSRINELAAEEHELFERESHANVSDADRERLRRIQVTLDQCWDLLRQRRARRAAGLDPGEARVRDEKIVEGYTG